MAEQQAGNLGNCIQDYEVLNFLGKGSSASVYRAICLKTRMEVAIKKIEKKKMFAMGMAKRVNREVAIHSRLNHPSILRLYTQFEDYNYVYLVLEHCHNGEINGYLKKNQKKLTEDGAREFLRQIVDGLLYLHSHNIMHRDLSTCNLLLTRNLEVKISDFGLAAQLSQSDEKHTTICGTPNFISPEVVTKGVHGLEADLWSLGCLLYVFLVGKPPFDTRGVQGTLLLVSNSDYRIPDGLSLEAKDLLHSLLQKNPNNRIKLSDILNHPFFKKPSNSYLKENRWLTQASVDSGFGTDGTNVSTSLSSRCTSGSRSKPLLAHPIGESFKKQYETSSPVLKASPQGWQEGRVSPHHFSSESNSYNQTNSKAFHNVQSSIKQYETSSSIPERSPHGWQDKRTSPLPFSPESNSHHPVSSNLKVGICNSESPDRRNGRWSPIANRHKTESEEARFNLNKRTLSGECVNCSTENDRQTVSCEFPHGLHPHLCDSRSNRQLNYCCGTADYESCRQKVQHNQRVDGGSYSGCIGQVLEPSNDRNCHSSRGTSPVSNHRPNENTSQKSIQVPLASPLNSSRLRPTRQKTKNAIISILEDGQVTVDFFKTNGGEEKIYESCTISPDGRQIAITRPVFRGNKFRNSYTSAEEYSYNSLPNNHWKKYVYAARFVKLVRAKTPKIIYYNSLAKCMLMENGPAADFEATFYSKERLFMTASEIKIVDRSGRETVVKNNEGTGELSADLQQLLRTFQEFHQHCLHLETCLTSVENHLGQTCFPVILGRKSSSSSSSPASQSIINKENVLQDCTSRFNSNSTGKSPTTNFLTQDSLVNSMMKIDLGKPDESVKYTNHLVPTSMKYQTSKNLIDSSVFNLYVKDVGWAYQLADGDIHVLRTTGSQLTYELKSKSLLFTDDGKNAQRYDLNEKGLLPQKIREELQHLFVVIEHFSKYKSSPKSLQI